MQEPPITEQRATILPSLSHSSLINGSQKNLIQPQVEKPPLEDNFSSKLSNVEAQRIMSVLQEAQRKVALVASLPEAVDRKVVGVLGNDIAGMIQAHRQVEEKYETLIRLENRNNTPDAKELARQLRSSTRLLCRNLLKQENILTKLGYISSIKHPALQRFEDALQEIKVLVYDRLRTTVEEEKAKQDQLSIIIAKEQKTTGEVKALQQDLDKARRERQMEVNRRNEIIKRLKEELREIKHQAEESTKKLESRSKQKEDFDMQQFRDKETGLLREMNRNKDLLEELRKKNKEEEITLRKKKFKFETEVENWIHKYDQEMEEKQNELEDIEAIFNEEKAQLEELQTKYNELQAHYNAILEEKKEEEEKLRKKEQEQANVIEAVTKIQALWRGYRARKEYLKQKIDKNSKKGKKNAKGNSKGKGKKK